MYFLIVSGMSGAGKSRTVAVLEDLGFYCVDNMPVELLPKFAEICMASAERYEHVALVVDVRARNNFKSLFAALKHVKSLGCDYKILYLDTATETLIRRYKETRRKHPLMTENTTITEAIAKEREILEGLRGKADFVVDTTALSLAKLKETIVGLFKEDRAGIFEVNVMSFGFKYGLPTEADLVFDVRFLPNPYYEISLREKNGTDPKVRDYVFRDGEADRFMEKLTDLIDYLIPRYSEEGKTNIVVGIGCTGGKHRSVAICEALTRHIQETGYKAYATHRDYQRG